MKKSGITLSMCMLLKLILVLVVLPLLPLLVSWRWNWWEAWVVTITLALGFFFSRLLAERKHPGIMTERIKSFSGGEAKPWDRILSPLMVFGGLLIPLIAGLEERFNWTPIPNSLALKVAAIALMLAAYAFGAWAMVENAYFSGVVRIQTDRGQVVCDTGPYRILRHPGYTGNILFNLAMPILLDSSWSFIIVVIMLLITIARTSLEDRTLQEELPGYREYAGRVKYRLFPGIW